MDDCRSQTESERLALDVAYELCGEPQLLTYECLEDAYMQATATLGAEPAVIVISTRRFHESRRMCGLASLRPIGFQGLMYNSAQVVWVSGISDYAATFSRNGSPDCVLPLL